MSASSPGLAQFLPDHAAPADPVPQIDSTPSSQVTRPEAPTTTTGITSATPRQSARSPAAQVGPVLVSLASGPAGAHRTVLRLDPPGLGRLEIRLVRDPAAGTRVDISAERPATLALLHRDEPALHQALTNAGLPADGRSLTMHLGQPGGQGSDAQAGSQRGSNPRGFAGPESGGETPSAVLPDIPLVPARGDLRALLDITA